MGPDFSRYSCQIALPGFGEKTQELLQNAKVLIIGAGGLGCPVAQYLAAAGIGNIGIADFDMVSEANLHRQILYTPADIGHKKVLLACQRLQNQNPGIRLTPYDLRVTSENVFDIVRGYDILVDCTDNFDTRYLLNDAAVITDKPLVYGAIYQYEGQVAVWNLVNKDGRRSPNYRDLFPEVDASQIPDCAEGGVIPTLAGIIGCLQANEVIKYVTQTGELLQGRVLMFDAQTLQSRIIKIGETTNIRITKLKDTFEAPTISVGDLKKRIAESNVELIDIRTEQEHAHFNIGGKHITSEQLGFYFEGSDKNQTTVLYCASGKRSGEAVKNIRKKYPEANVFSLENGLKAWLEQEK